MHLNNAPGRNTSIAPLESHLTFRGHLSLVSKRFYINLYELLRASNFKWILMDWLRTIQVSGSITRFGTLWGLPMRLQTREHPAQVAELKLNYFGSAFQVKCLVTRYTVH